jgi:glutamate synthase (NADPH/NADH) small chain
MYGIPNMKLDKTIVQRRIDLMAAEGVRFVANTEIGKDISAAQLVDTYDAVVLSCGATKPRDMSVDGRGLAGIHYAMDFLSANTTSLLNPGHAHVSAADKHVVVIGGGDTGTDCVGTAMRHGCRSLIQLEILPRPSVERPPDNPWPEWPRIHRTDYGHEEAVARFGEDPRRYQFMTRRFVGDGGGQVRELHTVQVEWTAGSNGRPIPRPVPGTERIWPADLVLLAMGFVGPEDGVLDQLDIGRDKLSNVRADFGRFATNVEGVFAAGDVRRGQSLVVWAIEEGRGAARECDRYLMGATDLP